LQDSPHLAGWQSLARAVQRVDRSFKFHDFMANEQNSLELPLSHSSAVTRNTGDRIAYYQVQPPEESETSSPVVPFAHYLWILRRHKWQLLAFVVVAVASTVIVSSRLTPYYESTATIDVDRMVPTGVIGQEATSSRASSMNDSDFYLSTQMQLIKSDSVLRPVVQRLKLPLPKRADAPIALRYLTVTRPPKTYLLTISYRDPDPRFAAEVANAVARSYRDYSYLIRYQATAGLSTFMQKQMEDLQAKMERSGEKLAQFQKDLNVISPDEKTNILSANLLQLNTEYTNAEADRFRKEAAAKSVASGSIEALEASAQGEQIRHLVDRVAEEQQKFASIKTNYGVNHIEYRKAANTEAELQKQFERLKADVARRVQVEYREAVSREEMLHQAVQETKADFESLNLKTYEYTNLKREADADRTLYEDLSRKIKEAGINAGFQNSSIRLADEGRPALRPAFPKIWTNAAVAFFASLFLGVMVIFLSDSLDHSLRDPDQIQRRLQTPVLGSLPVVKAWRGHLPSAHSPEEKHRSFFGDTRGVANSYEEAIRTLRDSILLPSADKRPRSLLVTSATPREGKTTTAVHLAVVHSQQKRRTLLIDADLRRPGVYHHVGVSNDQGMSNVVNGDVAWRDALLDSEGLPHLKVLPAGAPSRRAADGLGDTLRHVLAEAAAEYDLVICDAPPLLGFAESMQIASLVDGVVVVALAGQTEMNAVASVLNNLKRLNANVIGLVLNEVRADMSERYYYYGYYGKNYSRYYKPLAN
jgi:polysaccharide biosynthesis transport protein